MNKQEDIFSIRLDSTYLISPHFLPKVIKSKTVFINQIPSLTSELNMAKLKIFILYVPKFCLGLTQEQIFFKLIVG